MLFINWFLLFACILKASLIIKTKVYLYFEIEKNVLGFKNKEDKWLFSTSPINFPQPGKTDLPEPATSLGEKKETEP